MEEVLAWALAYGRELALLVLALLAAGVLLWAWPRPKPPETPPPLRVYLPPPPCSYRTYEEFRRDTVLPDGHPYVEVETVLARAGGKVPKRPTQQSFLKASGQSTVSICLNGVRVNQNYATVRAAAEHNAAFLKERKRELDQAVEIAKKIETSDLAKRVYTFDKGVTFHGTYAAPIVASGEIAWVDPPKKPKRPDDEQGMEVRI